MPIDLYHLLGSPPCRSVMLLAKALKLELNLKISDITKGENKSAAFLKLNPQHTIPTLDDNGFGLGESRAILRYLADKYGKNDSLYPKDPKKRAVVDQRLEFDAGNLYFGVSTYYLMPILNTGKEGSKFFLDKLEEGMNILNSILEGQDWVAGNSITIADYAVVVTVNCLEVLGYHISKHPNVSKWYTRSQKTMDGYHDINDKGAKLLKMFIGQSRK